MCCKYKTINYLYETIEKNKNKMRTLKKIDLTKEGEPQYTTFFYNKESEVCYEVISNGESCAVSLKDEIGISRWYNSGRKLPKYITSKL